MLWNSYVKSDNFSDDLASKSDKQLSIWEDSPSKYKQTIPWGYTSVTDCLSSKSKVLGSKFQFWKKKKKRKKLLNW